MSKEIILTEGQYDAITNALCDMSDVFKTLDSLELIFNKKIFGQPKDNDGSNYTLGDCLDRLHNDWLYNLLVELINGERGETV